MTRTATPEDVLAGRARWCVVEGDSADVLAALPPASCAALVTDPPAGIGFMGREWDKDRGGRAQWVAWLAGVLGLARVAVRPGGRAFVWALPRTTHWTGCAVEDAGWRVETVVTHLFGTGWPKGASQLKPSSEHWYLARTGPSTGLNVDGCRVGTQQTVTRQTGRGDFFTPGKWTGTRLNPPGRWPPNTLFSHSPGCERVGERRVQTATGHKANGGSYARGEASTYGAGLERDGTELVEAWRCVEGCPVAELDAQSGESVSSNRPSFNAARPVTASKGAEAAHVTGGFSDAGTASRFFPCFPADDPATFAYIAKPSRAERNEGVRVNPQPRRRRNELLPCDCYGNDRRDGNHHPTVKPVSLMRWLLRLITEPGDIVLDPFGGSGTTGVAALLEGRRVILVERDPEYAAIARQRCEAAEAEALRAAQHPREMPPRPRVPNGGLQEFSVLVRAPYATPPEGA